MINRDEMEQANSNIASSIIKYYNQDDSERLIGITDQLDKKDKAFCELFDELQAFKKYYKEERDKNIPTPCEEYPNCDHNHSEYELLLSYAVDYRETKIIPSEALFGFAGMLTTRERPITFSANHNAAVMADLVDDYCKVLGLEAPRDGFYPENIRIPEREVNHVT